MDPIKPKQHALATAILAAGLLASGTASAGGISLYEVGSADVGLAAAGYAARAQDASTVFTNPAGMTRLEGNQLSFGGQLLYGDVGYVPGDETTPALGTGDGGNPVEWFPGGGLFYSHSVSSDLKLGIAVTGNFGSVVEYEDDWVGRYYLQEGTLLGVSILPSIGWRATEKLSLGASLNVMYGKFDTRVAVNNLVGEDGELSLDDNVWGLGANLGLLYEASPATRFGLTYNSAVDLDFEARTQFEGLGPLVSALLSSRGLLDTDVDLGVEVPQGIMASFYHQVDTDWALLGNVGWQDWSRFGEVAVGVESNDPVSLTTELEFDDTWHVALGAQYQWSPGWLLNFGIAHDSAFQDDDAVALALPANAAWRFGIGGQSNAAQRFDWGWSLAYLWGGDLGTNLRANVPVALGGRGNVVGEFEDTAYFVGAVTLNWRF